MVKKKIPEKVKKEIDSYIEVLKEDKLPIKQVILFGSYAKGNPNKWSDIDLCIISEKFGNAFDTLQYLWIKRRKNYGLTIEPVGFNPRDFEDEDALIHEIKKTGIEVEI
jgi:hypothetical protein